MKRRATVAVLGLSLFGLTTAPVSGQLFNFPDYALLSADGAPSTFVAGSYGRGLNDNSGKLNAVSAMVGRSAGALSFAGGFGYVDSPLESEWTLGGSASYDLLDSSAPAQLALQTGLGWIKLPTGGVTTDDITMLRIPVGLAVKGNMSSSSAKITPWVMPRLNIVRASAGGASSTETDLGASAGIAISMPSGFGVHAAFDVLHVSAAGASMQQYVFGVGAHYMLGR